MKLVSMVDYVIQEIPKRTGFNKLGGVANALHVIHNYAKFLKQPLKLEMFVPCDDEGKPLEKPKQLNGVYDTEKDAIEAFEYCSAQEKVLFKLKSLPEIEDLKFFIRKETIELLTFGEDIELTENAIKQLKQ